MNDAATTTLTELSLDLGRRWVAAELGGDVAALDGLAAPGFQLVGPVGFVLDREQWLDRFGPDKLQLEQLEWSDVTVREHGDTAVMTGVQEQRATFAGQRADARFRVSHVAVRTRGTVHLVLVQLSPLGGPGPFAPPERPDASS